MATTSTGGGGDGRTALRDGSDAPVIHMKKRRCDHRPTGARISGRMWAPGRTATTRCRLCVGPGRGLPGNTGGYPTGHTPPARVVVTSTPTNVSRSVPLYCRRSETETG